MPTVQSVSEQALRVELARAYAELSEIARIRELLGKVDAPESVSGGMSDPMEFWKSGERRVLTTLFADVRSYTRFVANVQPEEAVAIMDVIFGCLHDAVRAEGGIVSRVIGDGMLALFGVPLPLEDHASAAAAAALKARATVDLLAEARRAQGLEPLRIGLGINTGEVVAGRVGTPERAEYTVVGHAVNVASRLVAAADPGQVLLGPRTAELLHPRFELREKGQIDLKGIGPTPVFELVGLRASFEGAGRPARPLRIPRRTPAGSP